MDNGTKQSDRPSPSFNELFAARDSTASLLAIIAPPPVVEERNPVTEETKNDDDPQQSRLNAIFERERGRVNQPCSLSDSIYYGTREDMYISANKPSGPSTPRVPKNETEDTNERGNWWKGGPYYWENVPSQTLGIIW